jgi:imidazolonepropionase-like amidohydrolase
MRSLVDDTDTLLAYPIQRDDQEASASRDLLPRYAFSPDSRALFLNYDGKIHRLDLASRRVETVAFHAAVDLPMGPYLRRQIQQETGTVRARLIQTPSLSPDSTRLTFSALGHVYVMAINDNRPRRLTTSATPEFNPAWSPDGRSIVYVTWTDAGGDIWREPADGAGLPQRLTDHSDFYTFPAFTPDGQNIVALRAGTYERNHHYMELPPARADVIELPAQGGPQTVLTSGVASNIPQFTDRHASAYISFSDGLYEVPLQDDAPKHRVLNLNGPTWYFVDGLAPADAIKISPDGAWALAQITQQLYLIQLPKDGSELTLELGKASPFETRLTSTGADFFDWADHGKTITWSLGSTFFRQSLASITTGSVDPPTKPDSERKGVTATQIEVTLPRDTPKGALVLRGATAITMHANTVIPNADVVIVDDHIAAVGPRGAVAIPPGATIRDVTGKYITPGFTDTHMHYADVRRGVLDLEGWGFAATLAYGVTSALDPSPLSIDMLAYQDLLDAGMMTGSRVYSTGPAVFSFNRFASEEQTLNVLARYPQLYRTRNLKEYRTGNRRQREWVLQAADKLHLLATTEGALDMKLDMTQIQDGFPGNEHAYSAVPLGDDIVQLFAQSGVSYTPTLQISNGGLPAQQFFFSTSSPTDDAKLRHFEPGFFLDEKLERLHWALPREYAFSQVAEGAAKIQRAGGIVGVGSHGELPGLGYHLELQALARGGMTPGEVLYAATMGSSKTIGRDAEFGSLEPGKFADLLIMSKNPLTSIENTLSLEEVMKNGRLYNANTLAEQWPRQRAPAPLWFQTEQP